MTSGTPPWTRQNLVQLTKTFTKIRRCSAGHCPRILVLGSWGVGGGEES